MTTGKLWFGGMLVAVMLTLTPMTRAADDRFDRDRLQKVSDRMQDFIKSGKLAGAVTLVATTDEVVHLAATGQADIENGRAMQTDSIFRIASMTKTVTAAALMMLVDEGKLSLNDPIAKHLPSFKGQKVKDGSEARAITVRDVMTHTAGLAQPPREAFDSKSLADIVDGIGQTPLEFQPGSKWQYSSGLTVAGRLIEVLSGQSYADFLKQRLFDPLGMRDTSFVLTKEQAARLAVTYEPSKEANKGPLAAAKSNDPTVARTPNPSGGLYSTASDMVRFYQMVLGGGSPNGKKYLSAAAIADMLKVQSGDVVTGFTPGNGWGIGWCVLREPQGVTRLLGPGTYGHGGAWGTQAWVDPQRGLILLLMIQRANFGNSDGSDVRDAFNEAVLTAHHGQANTTARFTPHLAYQHSIELKVGDARAVLCPQVGGRVLEFSVGGKDSMWLDPKENDWKPGQPGNASAGRFDFGPELTTPSHPKQWSGEWTGEILSNGSARLISQKDEASGVQLTRTFSLSKADGKAARLDCTQTIMNVSNEVREYGHWGRSFSPGGGICLIPLQGKSKYPSKYAMYEDSAIINVKPQDDRIRERDGFLEILSPPRKPKLGFDSQAGWLAYLAPNNVLFVKRFKVDPTGIYNEAAGLTTSVWYPEGARIELEPIGPRAVLKPGDVASFTETWYAVPHPFPAAGQNVDLVALRKLVETTMPQ